MAQKRDRSLDLPKKANEGFFREFHNNLKLIVRLLKDSRVNFWLKLLPIGALIYLIFPMDAFPINPLDDALVIWLGGYLFIELCPQAIVQEHKNALKNALSDQEDAEEAPKEVIDGEFREKKIDDGGSEQ
jgi:uncharacterized membrane protein YkvA (DUF1232 family)